MPIVQAGAVNTTALLVPDVYVQIVPPQNLTLNGVPTDAIGAVGTAAWGPVNIPSSVATMADYAKLFGPIQARKYDLGTQVGTAVQQGAQNFELVRVTDGTDVAAAAFFNGTAGSNCGFVATSLYTGSAANGDTLTLNTGSKAGSYKLFVARPGIPPEIYDNLTGAGAAFWTNLIAAVNTGNGPTRPQSQLVALSAGAGANASVAPSSLTLPMVITLGTGTGSVVGVDGVATLSGAVLIGQDTIPRKGMYALREKGCSIILLADVDDSTQWSTEAAFALSEGAYCITVGPAGDTIANAITAKAAAGLDCYGVKHMFGDWLWWNDTVNGVTRLVSPQGFAAGRLANLSPEQSSLNKQMYSIVGSQKSGQAVSGQGGVYAANDLALLAGAGIDVIANPSPGGNYWGVRIGHNSSSDPGRNGDNYVRLTNYLAKSLDAGMGIYVGETVNLALLRRITVQMGVAEGESAFVGRPKSEGVGDHLAINF